MKSKRKIYAEQYVEVIHNEEGGWDVELVIETIDRKTPASRHFLATFDTETQGDLYADALRWQYDKSIFEHELM